MKNRILKALGVGAAALAIALPASAAISISLDIVGQDLQVNAAGVFGPPVETVTAYDLDVTFNALLDGNLLGVTPSDQLGTFNFLDYLFFDTINSGNVNGFGLSLLTNAQVDAIQTTDPVLLFTLNFDGAANLAQGNFALGANGTVGCATPNAPGVVECFPPQNQAPEPMSLALVALALVGAGAAGRRRKARA